MLWGVEQKLHVCGYRLQYPQLCILYTAGVVNAGSLINMIVYAHHLFVRLLTSVLPEVSLQELTT
jgi:hypothetical protein